MQKLKSIIKHFIFKTKMYKLNSLRNQFYIIPYHMIVDEPNGFYPQMSTGDFERQIQHLAGHYRILSLDDILTRVKNRKSLRRCVAITFDDGFKDNYENAYPILREYDVPATIFLTTGYIENGTAPWFIKLRYIFMKTQKTDFQFSLKNKTISFPVYTNEEKFAASEAAMAYLKECPERERLTLIQRLSEELGVSEFEDLDGLMLNWNHITQMPAELITFGAHTVSHPVLTRIPLETVKQEISQSKRTIESRLDRCVNAFAYPFGKKPQYNRHIFPILERLGFQCALTTELGTNGFTTNLFELKRSAPWELGLIST